MQQELVARASYGVSSSEGCCSSPSSSECQTQAAHLDAQLGCGSSGSKGDTILQEVNSFLHEQPLGHQADPLDWWRTNAARFPQLAPVARSVGCILATSTPAERVFSTAGLVVGKLRSKLATDMVDSLVFLHKNRSWLCGEKRANPQLPALFQPLEETDSNLPRLE